MSTGSHEHGEGTDGTTEFGGGEFANPGQGTFIVSGYTKGTQQADTTGHRIGKQTSEWGVPPTTVDCSLSEWSKSSGNGSTTKMFQGIARGLPPNTSGRLPTFNKDPVELLADSLSRHHFELRFPGFEVNGKVEDREPTAENIIDPGLSEPTGEARACLSDQERRMHHVTQSSGVWHKIRETEESESHPNHISFKLPVLKIPDAESLGFSFSPRFEETTRSLKTQDLKPALNPFEVIERQGRCSPLNHSQSLPSSRHHSRSSTVGLQAFRPFPSAMKTSKETGDQPPVIPSPSLLYGTTKKKYGDNKALTEGTFWPNVSRLFL